MVVVSENASLLETAKLDSKDKAEELLFGLATCLADEY